MKDLSDIRRRLWEASRSSQAVAKDSANGSYQKGMSNGEAHAYMHAAKMLEAALAALDHGSRGT